MKVLKEGKDTVIVCPACKSKLSISQTDILPNKFAMETPDEYGHVICPCCGKQINLTRSGWTGKWVIDSRY